MPQSDSHSDSIRGGGWGGSLERQEGGVLVKGISTLV